ncbi:MAG: hypothetical protein LW768_02275 [Rubrivivax sp.]|nr:hypothetical protein [Rubrivivax sp.]
MAARRLDPRRIGRSGPSANREDVEALELQPRAVGGDDLSLLHMSESEAAAVAQGQAQFAGGRSQLRCEQRHRVGPGFRLEQGNDGRAVEDLPRPLLAGGFAPTLGNQLVNDALPVILVPGHQGLRAPDAGPPRLQHQAIAVELPVHHVADGNAELCPQLGRDDNASTFGHSGLAHDTDAAE